ncbi:transmembrane amino acid transporter protein-domain-containing protein [Vararia minispora EC-137]|uniref:Transmembrane amino acid transporter protein-domain-containing protein n=1 Tax=Vararia minispora EC-137 TaxID=1314806 RepID=A0ACB8QXQ6_9AGAM|nr:transmembrane amino acid transporter protein-domain-containing protein [Vararia minispora EC-137]
MNETGFLSPGFPSPGFPSPAPLRSAASEHTPLLHRPSRGTLRRRVSTVTVQPTRPPGRSTFRQTLFNACALLLGIGMLSEPLAFSYAGWIGGTALMVFYGYLTCYTAKFLARITITDPTVRSYADIGLKAFGARSASIVSVIFCLEIFTLSVILETLYADSLHAVLPALSSNTYKLISFVFLIPGVFLPLSALSYTSLTGILSTICLVLVIFIDGLSKTEAPGSLIDPAKTSLLPDSWKELGMAFGLFMAGFGAHAAMPSIVEDMAEPDRFEEAMNYSFGFATLFYSLIGMAGYLMFGNDVSEEVSQNLLGVPGYSKGLNQLVLWMLVLSSLTKFPLALRPLNVTLEIIMGLDTLRDPHSIEHAKSDHGYEASTKTFSTRFGKRILFIAERSFFVFFAVIVSIFLPDFGAMMAILGAFTTFLLCIIGPLAAKMSLEGFNMRDSLFLVIAVPMAVWGTTVAFMPM